MKTSFAAMAELGAQIEKRAASARIAMTLVRTVIVLMAIGWNFSAYPRCYQETDRQREKKLSPFP